MLTERGRQKAEDLVRSLVEIEEESLLHLTKTERTQLDSLLTKLLKGLAE